MRWDSLEAQARADLDGVAEPVRIVGRRAGRIAGGMMAAGCGAGAMGTALGMGVMKAHQPAVAGWLLLLAAPLAVATALVARSLAARRASRRLQQMLVPTAFPLEDVARLERRRPRDEIAEWLESLEVSSYAWPLAGVALVAPLLLHFVVYFVVAQGELAPFGRWIAMSAVIAAAPHITFVALAIRHARRLAEGASYSSWAAVGCITASSLFPFVLALGLPPLITFVTAGVLVPTSFRAMQGVAERERAALAAQ